MRKHTAYITKRVSLQDVRDAKPKMIYYGALTCWWTHDPYDLCHLTNGLPCDPRGGVLMQTDDIEGFLRSAEANPAHYGRHGLDAFMASHHKNCLVSLADVRSTCFETWDAYNDAIDETVVADEQMRIGESLLQEMKDEHTERSREGV